MASLLRRTAVLSFSRFSNQAIVFLSPVLLVRILSVAEYGSYREFMLYAGTIGPLISFGIARSLPFLIPKHPEKERVWITQTIAFVLIFSVIANLLILVAGDYIKSATSFDFVFALQLYLFFFINFDFIELFWIGKKRTDLVLYYSSGRLLVRTVVVIAAAYLTEDARLIVYSLIVLECARCAVMMWYSVIRKKWLTKKITRDSLSLQMSYFLPLGSGAVVETLNSSAGKLFISVQVGATGLAYYVIGAFAIRVVNILRGAVADAIFPDIVEIRSAEPKDALPLWQKATLWYCVMLLPIAALFLYYSDAIVTILFTTEYEAAVPVFSCFALMLVTACFDFHLPLRAQNANKYFVIGSVIALATNVALLFPMYKIFGLIGPAVGFLISRLMMTIYLANRAAYVYKIKIADLLPWHQIKKTVAAVVICVPVLVVGKISIDQLFIRSVVFGTSFFAIYLYLLRRMEVWDVLAQFRRLVRSARRGV
jgi:O-antigen/teichoic acid export membrane protein